MTGDQEQLWAEEGSAGHSLSLAGAILWCCPRRLSASSFFLIAREDLSSLELRASLMLLAADLCLCCAGTLLTNEK